MKKAHIFKKAMYSILLCGLLAYTLSCSNEQALPNPTLQKNDELKVIARTDGDCIYYADTVKVRVAERDHIPIQNITGCYYYGPYINGDCEFRCTTINYGTPVYIIGDDYEGF